MGHKTDKYVPCMNVRQHKDYLDGPKHHTQSPHRLDGWKARKMVPYDKVDKL